MALVGDGDSDLVGAVYVGTFLVFRMEEFLVLLIVEFEFRMEEL